MAKGTKTARNCYTCQYWKGYSVKVVSPNFVEYDQSEQATCNKTGFNKKAWMSCNQHEKRWDF